MAQANRKKENIYATEGITWVSRDVRNLALKIKRSAPDGSSRIYSEEQRAEMLKKIEPHRIKAEDEGRFADVKFFERTIKSINNLKLAKTTHRLKKFRIK